jgi:nitroreductase
MTPSTPDQLLRQLDWRYATKRFDPQRTIAPATWSALEQALQLAPSSFGLQPWKFLVIDDKALRQQLRQHSWGQSQVGDASHYVVFTGLRTMTMAHVDRALQRQCEVRGVTMATVAGYRSVLEGFLAKGWAAGDLGGWNTRQVYLALGQFMTAAAMLGVDTCPMEGIDMAGYDRVLGLDGSPFTTRCACAAGYRSADDKYAEAKKARFPLGEVVEHR